MDATAARLAAFLSTPALVPFTQREQVVLPVEVDGAQPFETGVPFLEVDVDPPAAFEVARFVAFVDLRLVCAVGVFLALIERRTARTAGCGMRGGWGQAHRDASTPGFH